jgi:hypothetical protein
VERARAEAAAENIPFNFRKMPVKLLLNLPYKRFSCHRWRMTAHEIFSHQDLSLNEWLKNMLNVERCFLHGKHKKISDGQISGMPGGLSSKADS